MRVQSERPLPNGGYIHSVSDSANFTADFLANSKGSIDESTTFEPLSKRELDGIYRALLSLLPLTPVHKKSLAARGISDEEMTQHGFRSIKQGFKKQIVPALLKQFGAETFSRVPGFGQKNGRYGPYNTLICPDGIVIPVKSPEGFITALRLRKDKAAKGPKIVWFSSRKYGGLGPGYQAHWARPQKVGDAGELWITEGEIKSIIVAERLKALVLSVPGVTNWKRYLPDIFRSDPGIIYIAYDADKAEKAEVLRHEQGLATALYLNGFKVKLVNWDGSKGKGLDDFLLENSPDELSYQNFGADEFKKGLANNAYLAGGATFTVSNPSLIEKIKSEMLATDEEFTTVEDARGKHYRLFVDILKGHKTGHFLVKSGTGTGKTTSAFLAIADLLASGWPTIKMKRSSRLLRVAYISDSKEIYDQFGAIMQPHMERGDVAILQGRASSRNSPAYCAFAEKCNTYSQNRHIAMRDVCQPGRNGELGCEYVTEMRNQTSDSDWLCPYLRQAESADHAAFVISTKKSILNRSKKTQDFDVIIIDESLEGSLVETLTLTADQVNQWQAGLNELRLAEERLDRFGAAMGLQYTRYDDQFQLLLTILRDSIMQGQGLRVHEQIPLVDIVTAHPRYNDLDINFVLKQAKDSQGRYTFEKPFKNQGNKWIFPLRLMADLLERLDFEIFAKGETGSTDSQLWLNSQGIKIAFPMVDLIRLLREKTVVNLDSTPSPLVGLIFPEVKNINYVIDDRKKRRIKLYNDLSYTKRHLAKNKGDLLRAVQYEIERIRGDEGAIKTALIISHKRFNPDAEGYDESPKIELKGYHIGHYGKDTKGLNLYQDVDAIFVIGRYIADINSVIRMAQAIRSMEGFSRLAPAGPTERVVYFVNRKGECFGRLQHSERDSLVQECIVHSERSELLQAIGRGRALLRPDDKPLLVYIFGSGGQFGLEFDEFGALDQRKKIKQSVEVEKIFEMRMIAIDRLSGKGLKPVEIAEELRIPLSTVYRYINKLEKEISLNNQGGSLITG